MRMIPSIVFERTLDAWLTNPRYISSCGGTRSGKTFSNLQLLYIYAAKHKVTISVVSETFPHLKRGAIRDFTNILGTAWDDTKWSKTDSIYTLSNGSIIEFFSADSPAKVHGPARDILFLNEAQNIPYDIARQLFVRTRERIILDYNPTHSFWLNEKIEPLENCKCIHSTYLDNCDATTHKSFLTEAMMAEIESNKADASWWQVYGLGQVGKLEGVIYDFTQVDALPDADGMIDVYGMDFGFSNDPTTLIHCLIDNRKKEIWLDEVCYRRGMLNADIARTMEEAQVPKRSTPIFADCAEPKTIAELASYGWNVRPCYKATRKAEQIQVLKGYHINITKRSLNTIKEARGYVWQKDKDGSPINEPTPINDHAMDAFRYGCFTFLSEYKNKGHYNIKIQ